MQSITPTLVSPFPRCGNALLLFLPFCPPRWTHPKPLQQEQNKLSWKLPIHISPPQQLMWKKIHMYKCMSYSLSVTTAWQPVNCKWNSLWRKLSLWKPFKCHHLGINKSFQIDRGAFLTLPSVVLKPTQDYVILWCTLKHDNHQNLRGFYLEANAVFFLPLSSPIRKECFFIKADLVPCGGLSASAGQGEGRRLKVECWNEGMWRQRKPLKNRTKHEVVCGRKEDRS